jgi:peptide/nickel transport system substrate-binding protein
MRIGLLGLLVMASVACAPAGGTTAPQAGGDAPPAPARAQTLALATRSELDTLTGKALGSRGGVGDSSARRLFNADFAILDERGTARPYLAEALPTLNTDTWRLLPDGRMETTYRLKPAISWHDGVSLSAQDYVFAWRVYATPAFGVAASTPVSHIEDVIAPDQRTVVIRWRRLYPEADALQAEDFQALPRHLLEAAFEQDMPDAFMSRPFWSTEYVGLGPYRAARWEPGSFLEAVAFDGHILGRPRINRVQLRFIGDSNTVMANLLAGEVHVTLPYTIYTTQATVLRREWSASGGTVIVVPAGWRKAEPQHRPEYANPRAILDVRVRAALAHALDKDALNESLFEGQGFLADVMIPPTKDYYPLLERVIRKYPLDPRRSEQLMADAGFARGGDGFYAGRGEGRIAIELRANLSADLQLEMSTMAGQWRDAGFDIRESPVSLTQARDGQFRATFPGMYNGGGGFGEAGLATFVSSAISGPENRWGGGNRLGYSNAEYDGWFEAFSTTLDRSERSQQIAQMTRIFTEDVAAISLHFSPNVIARAGALRGPAAFSPESLPTWNVHEWELG